MLDLGGLDLGVLGVENRNVECGMWGLENVETGGNLYPCRGGKWKAWSVADNAFREQQHLSVSGNAEVIRSWWEDQTRQLDRAGADGTWLVHLIAI